MAAFSQLPRSFPMSTTVSLGLYPQLYESALLQNPQDPSCSLDSPLCLQVSVYADPEQALGIVNREWKNEYVDCLPVDQSISSLIFIESNISIAPSLSFIILV